MNNDKEKFWDDLQKEYHFRTSSQGTSSEYWCYAIAWQMTLFMLHGNTLQPGVELCLIIRFGSINEAFKKWMLNKDIPFNIEENEYMNIVAKERYPNLNLVTHRNDWQTVLEYATIRLKSTPINKQKFNSVIINEWVK